MHVCDDYEEPSSGWKDSHDTEKITKMEYENYYGADLQELMGASDNTSFTYTAI